MKLKGIVSKSFVRAILCVSLFGLVVQFLFPVRTSLIRLSFLLLIMSSWLCIFCLSRPKSKIRKILLGFIIFVILFCCMPSRQINQVNLRKEYVNSLYRYESRPYVWGAENFFAVDCSGLIRQGFIDANVCYGLKTFNGALVREAILLWWYDSSAKAMRDGYRGRTIRIMDATNVNELDHDRILPGDFAVTQNGVHRLAYLGDGRWIQADPNPHKVVIGKVPVEDSGWFKTSVYIMRWSEFKK